MNESGPQGTRDEAERMADEALLLTVDEVAHVLRLSVKGVYGLVEARRIPFVKISNRLRFLKTDVLSFLSENRVSALERR